MTGGTCRKILINFCWAFLTMVKIENLRNDLDEEVCTDFRKLNTTYNGEKSVPPYVGIMFEISAFTDVEIKTFEVDIRWDLNPKDLSVHVFTRSGPYIGSFNQSNDWTRVASTNLVLAAEGNSGIIPVTAFSPVKVEALSRQSFYVSMTDAFIDHTVYALQKTGDIHLKGDDLQLYVGTGFTSDDFPDTFDKVLHPQFAGIIHYEKTFQCSDPLASSTEIEFLFLFERKELDASFVLNCNSIVDAEINDILESNENLAGFVLDYGLQKSSGSTTDFVNFSGQCPSDWIECPSLILRSKIHLQHMSSLDSSRIQFEAYKKTTIDLVLDALLATSNVRQVVSLGVESTSLDFRIVVLGASEGRIMNEVQTHYFQETTKYFLDFSIGNCVVFDLEVDSQDLAIVEDRRQLQRYLTSKGALEITGRLLGAHPATSSVTDFKKVIETAFRIGEKTYIDLLKGNMIRPGRIVNDPSFSYFLDITSANCSITMEAPSSRKSKSFVGITILGSVIGTFIIAGAFLFFRHIKRERQKRKDRALHREKRRRERNARRLEQFTREISVKSLDVVSVNPISDRSKLRGSDSRDKLSCSIPYPAVNHPRDITDRAKTYESSSGQIQNDSSADIVSKEAKRTKLIPRAKSSRSISSLPNLRKLHHRDTITKSRSSHSLHVTGNKSNRSSVTRQRTLSNSDVEGASRCRSLSPNATVQSTRIFCDVKSNKCIRTATSLQHIPTRKSKLEIPETSKRLLLSSDAAIRKSRSLCDLKVQNLPRSKSSLSSISSKHTSTSTKMNDSVGQDSS